MVVLAHLRLKISKNMSICAGFLRTCSYFKIFKSRRCAKFPKNNTPNSKAGHYNNPEYSTVLVKTVVHVNCLNSHRSLLPAAVSLLLLLDIICSLQLSEKPHCNKMTRKRKAASSSPRCCLLDSDLEGECFYSGGFEGCWKMANPRMFNGEFTL